MFSVEHASSKGPAVMEGGGGGGGEQQTSCFVAKQAVEFPQVLASCNYSGKLCTLVQYFYRHGSCITS